MTQENARTIGGVIKALDKMTADRGGRYQLQALKLEDHKVVAADGYVVGIVEFADTLEVEGLFEIDKPDVRKRKLVELFEEDNKLVVKQVNGERVNRLEKVEGPYPNYGAVVFPKNNKETVCLNIERLQKVIDLMECAGYDTIEFVMGKDSKSPVRVDGVNRADEDIVSVTTIIGAVKTEDTEL